MKAETPAQGILKTRDLAYSKMYKVVCECTDDDHAIDFEVEADESGIMVNTFTVQKTDWWTESVKKRYDIDNKWLQEFDWAWKDLWNGLMTRLRLTKDIWFRGYVKYHSTTIMTKQQALNYAETLKSAIAELEQFHNKQNT